MSQTTPEPAARASVASVGDLAQVQTLLEVYAGALAEARSWHDPGVAALIATLELLEERARCQARDLLEEERVGALLGGRPADPRRGPLH